MLAGCSGVLKWQYYIAHLPFIVSAIYFCLASFNFGTSAVS